MSKSGFHSHIGVPSYSGIHATGCCYPNNQVTQDHGATVEQKEVLRYRSKPSLGSTMTSSVGSVKVKEMQSLTRDSKAEIINFSFVQHPDRVANMVSSTLELAHQYKEAHNQLKQKIGYLLRAVGDDAGGNRNPCLYLAGWRNLEIVENVSRDIFHQHREWKTLKLVNESCSTIRGTIRGWSLQLKNNPPRPGDAVLIDGVTRAAWRGSAENPDLSILHHYREVASQDEPQLSCIMDEIMRLVSMVDREVRILILGPFPRYAGIACCRKREHQDHQGIMGRSLQNFGHLHAIGKALRRKAKYFPNVAIIGANDLAGCKMSKCTTMVEFYKTSMQPDGISITEDFAKLLITVATDYRTDAAQQ